MKCLCTAAPTFRGPLQPFVALLFDGDLGERGSVARGISPPPIPGTRTIRTVEALRYMGPHGSAERSGRPSRESGCFHFEPARRGKGNHRADPRRPPSAWHSTISGARGRSTTAVRPVPLDRRQSAVYGFGCSNRNRCPDFDPGAGRPIRSSCLFGQVLTGLCHTDLIAKAQPRSPPAGATDRTNSQGGVKVGFGNTPGTTKLRNGRRAWPVRSRLRIVGPGSRGADPLAASLSIAAPEFGRRPWCWPR